MLTLYLDLERAMKTAESLGHEDVAEQIRSLMDSVYERLTDEERAQLDARE